MGCILPATARMHPVCRCTPGNHALQALGNASASVLTERARGLRARRTGQALAAAGAYCGGGSGGHPSTRAALTQSCALSVVLSMRGAGGQESEPRTEGEPPCGTRDGHKLAPIP